MSDYLSESYDKALARIARLIGELEDLQGELSTLKQDIPEDDESLLMECFSILADYSMIKDIDGLMLWELRKNLFLDLLSKRLK